MDGYCSGHLGKWPTPTEIQWLVEAMVKCTQLAAALSWGPTGSPVAVGPRWVEEDAWSTDPPRGPAEDLLVAGGRVRAANPLHPSAPSLLYLGESGSRKLEAALGDQSLGGLPGGPSCARLEPPQSRLVHQGGGDPPNCPQPRPLKPGRDSSPCHSLAQPQWASVSAPPQAPMPA